MKSIGGFMLSFLVIFLSTAWAQVSEPENLSQAISLVPVLVAFIQSGEWLMFGVGCSLLLTFAAKKYVLPQIGAGNYWLPLISVGIGAMSGVGGAIAAGATPVAALLALLSGPLASTLWEVVFKYLLKKNSSTDLGNAIGKLSDK